MAPDAGECQIDFALPSSIGRKKTVSAAVDAFIGYGKNNEMELKI